MTPRVLGLIGAIGAGKSAAASCLSSLGGEVVDADRIGHAVLDANTVTAHLVRRWGESILHEGRVNRKAVAAVVFDDPAERLALEAIVYPEIHRRCHAAIKASTAPFVVLDAAVMLEAGWTLVDRILYIDAPRELRLKRVTERGWSAEHLAARESAQWPAERKTAVAEAIVMNDGTLEALSVKLREHLQAWGWI